MHHSFESFFHTNTGLASQSRCRISRINPAPKKLRDFLLDGCFLIRRETTQPLLNRFGTFIKINSVLSQLSRDTWHIGRIPSEDIVVVPKKVSEREFLFLRKVSTDGHHLGGITRAEINLHNIRLLRWERMVGFLAGNSKSSGLAWLAKVAISSLSKSA
jgi:hypothetical protein